MFIKALAIRYNDVFPVSIVRVHAAVQQHVPQQDSLPQRVADGAALPADASHLLHLLYQKHRALTTFVNHL